MDNVFTAIARKETTLSPIMEGKERISIDDIISNYSDGITIIAFDIITTGADSFPVLAFKEDAGIFAFGGAIIKNIIDGWIEHFEGDIETANNELDKVGGVKVRFSKGRTKSGNNITNVEVL